MPWTPSEFNDHHLGGKASKDQARRAAGRANGVLASCLKAGVHDREYCEGYAVRAGRAEARRRPKKTLSTREKKMIDDAVHKAVDEYGDVFEYLAKE